MLWRFVLITEISSEDVHLADIILTDLDQNDVYICITMIQSLLLYCFMYFGIHEGPTVFYPHVNLELFDCLPVQ